MSVLFIIGLLAVVLPLVFIGVLRGLYRVAKPDEVLVISGMSRRGYRLQQGGGTIVYPLVERVGRLDLSNMQIDLRVQGAYSRGGIPLSVEGVANVKVASTEPVISNAIERFLGRPRQEIMAVARETLEGNLRGVLATLTPEEVNDDRIKFAQNLLEEAGEDLQRLGLVLDTLKIQHVSDDRGYLDSIGRRQSAELQMKSRIAEAHNRALAMERDASNFEEKELRRIAAEIEIAKAEATKQLSDAQTQKTAMVAEELATVEAMVAKETAEIDVQRARIEQIRRRLRADVIAPAEAERVSLIEKARADAAEIVEEGKATATALLSMNESWRLAGGNAERIFVAQKLGSLVDKMMSTVEKTKIDRVTVVDRSLAEPAGSLAGKAIVAGKLLKETTGFDLATLGK